MTDEKTDQHKERDHHETKMFKLRTSTWIHEIR